MNSFFRLPILAHVTNYMEYHREDLFMSQFEFAKLVLESANMIDCEPVGTHIPLGHTLYRERQTESEEITSEMAAAPYCSLLGSLIYLSTCTPPDI